MENSKSGEPNLIIESTGVFQEPEVVASKDNKVIFRMVLQDCDVPNQNNRIYPQKVLASSMVECSNRMKRRAFLGELDHPELDADDNVNGARQTTVLLKEASHIIRDFDFKDNILFGELESLNTPNGKILYSLLKSKVGIGISMRGMASLEKNRDGYNVVQDPLLIVSYDIVSNPSHKSSLVNFQEMTFESKSLIQESNNRVCLDGKCYLPDYFDKLIEQKFIKFWDSWV